MKGGFTDVARLLAMESNGMLPKDYINNFSRGGEPRNECEAYAFDVLFSLAIGGRDVQKADLKAGDKLAACGRLYCLRDSYGSTRRGSGSYKRNVRRKTGRSGGYT